MVQLEFFRHGEYFLGVADKDDVGKTVGNNAIGGGESTGFKAFWQHYALTVFACARSEVCKQIHLFLLVWVSV